MKYNPVGLFLENEPGVENKLTETSGSENFCTTKSILSFLMGNKAFSLVHLNSHVEKEACWTSG